MPFLKPWVGNKKIYFQVDDLSTPVHEFLRKHILVKYPWSGGPEGTVGLYITNSPIHYGDPVIYMDRENWMRPLSDFVESDSGTLLMRPSDPSVILTGNASPENALLAEAICPICMEPAKTDNVKLKCSHCFCKDCMKKYHAHKTNVEKQTGKKNPLTCPYCRMAIDMIQMVQTK